MPDYNPSIPTGAQNLSDSQVDILNNFTELNTIFASDHFQWNFATTGDRGLHRRVSFPTPLTSDPSVAGDDSVVYSKLVSGITQLFFKNATTSEKITGSVVTQSGNGGIDFPQSVSIRWGSATFSGTSAVISYATQFPVNTYTVVISPVNSVAAGATLRVGTHTQTGFTVNAAINVTNSSFNYIAIGH